VHATGSQDHDLRSGSDGCRTFCVDRRGGRPSAPAEAGAAEYATDDYHGGGDDDCDGIGNAGEAERPADARASLNPPLRPHRNTASAAGADRQRYAPRMKHLRALLERLHGKRRPPAGPLTTAEQATADELRGTAKDSERVERQED
jgi:hypothetical protein